MFADERGYLVTEMVWEEMADDEPDEATVPVSNESSTAPAALAAASKASSGEAKAKAKPAAAPVPAKKSGPPAGQKSMMSFFGKKA